MTGMTKLKAAYKEAKPRTIKSMKANMFYAIAYSAAAFLLGVKAVKHYGDARARQSGMGDIEYVINNFKDDEE